MRSIAKSRTSAIFNLMNEKRFIKHTNKILNLKNPSIFIVLQKDS